MLGLIGYLIGVFVIAAILTFVVAVARPIRQKDEFKSWRVFASMFIVCATIPYLYAEVKTRLLGEGMEFAIRDVIYGESDNGELVYYRVLGGNQESANVIAVAQETVGWGGRERPVFRIEMVRQGDDWVAVSYQVVNSMDRGRDGYSLPPYW